MSRPWTSVLIDVLSVVVLLLVIWTLAEIMGN